MHGSGSPIWFFIGVLLVIYGAMILGYGVFEWVNVAHYGGQYPAGVQLTSLHTPVWWGGLLAALGVLYVVKFRPWRAGK
jgi:hypothetical protein